MGPRLQLYLKTFLVSSVLFGLGLGLLLLVFKPFELSFGGLLLIGLIYGAAMSLVLDSLHILMCPDSKTRKGLSVDQHRILRLPVPMERAFELCRAALEANKWCIVVRADKDAGVLRARRKFTWRSWGDVITLTLHPESADQTRVDIRSCPRVRTTLVDYGSNWRNTEALSNWPQEHGAVPAIAGGPRGD